MRIFFRAAAFVTISCSCAGSFSLGAELPQDFTNAVRPLVDGVPEVAVTRLQRLLATGLPIEQRRDAQLKLGEAFAAEGAPEKALEVLPDAGVRDLTEAIFWRAQAFAALNCWSDALAAYENVSNATSPLRTEALFGAANSLRALRRNDEALKRYQQLFPDAHFGLQARYRAAEIALDRRDLGMASAILAKAQGQTAAEKQERRFLRARLEAESNHPEKAIELLDSIIKNPDATTHPLLLATLFALTNAHLQLRSPESADDPLEEFIDHHPADPDLPRVFAELDRVYQMERKPARTELARWTRDPAQPRRALAQWYLARAELRADRRANAMETFGELLAGGAKDPALAEGYAQFAELQVEDRHFGEALAILDAARALGPDSPTMERISWLIAQCQYRSRNFTAASQEFEELDRSDQAVHAPALFNASLAWLQAGDTSAFQKDYAALGAAPNSSDVRADLLLEQGLTEAARGEGNAVASLRNFLRDFPQSKRASEAWVALAELAFHASPPQLDAAKSDLQKARSLHPNAAAIERADYLRIWIEDAAARDGGDVVSFATQFLQKHPASPFTVEVRMKLAEIYYQRQDFANAQTQFELLVQQDPKSPFAEKALFFAAESAMNSMGHDSLAHALTLFDEVAQKDGELKFAARNEQAIVERKLGKPQEALVLYDEVLKGNARPGEKREALCGKGDIFFELGSTDAKNYPKAVELYDQLIADAQAPPHWRNQALFKKGVCQERMNELDNALATFYRVLEDQGQPGRPREFFWFYKAGFSAARLLEDESKWTSAAGIYQKLAGAGGTRSEEAQTRLSQLRLEHFLWDR